MNDRTLHLLDIEYLGCGPQVSAHDIDLILGVYKVCVDWRRGDIAVGAVSTWVYKRIAFDLAGDVRLLPAGGGPDAADLRIIEEAHTIDLTRYDRVIIGSGDHGFADLAAEIRSQCVPVAAAGYRFNMARQLVDAVDEVIDLAGGYGLAA